MTDLRDVATVASARFDDDQIAIREFVKVEFTGGPGTLRYTNKPSGFVGDIDGSSQTWTELANLTIGPLQQGRDSALEVSWVEFPDADAANTWVGYLTSPGVRGVPCTIYRAHYSVSSGALYDAYTLYEGEMDEGRDMGTRVRVVLVPAGERTQVPGRAFLPHMDEFLLMPKPGETIVLGNVTVTLNPGPAGNPQPIIPYVPVGSGLFYF